MNPIYNEKDCLDQAQLLRYVYDECSPEEARMFDRHLDSCPLCSAAVEGLMSVKKEEVEETLTNIEHFIQTKTNKQTNMLAIKQTTNKRWISWAVAASVVTVASALWLLKSPEPMQNNSQMMADVTYDASNALATTPSRVIDTSNTQKIQQDSLTQAVAIAPDSNSVQPTVPADVALNDEESAPNLSMPPANNNTSLQMERLNESDNKKEDFGFKAEPANEAATNKPTPQQPAMETAKEEKVVTMARKQNANSTMPPQVTNSTQKARTKILESDESVYEEGLAFYKNGAYATAIERFNAVVSRKGWGNVYEDALWYMGNSHLKQGDKTYAKAVFERIVREKGRYSKEAEKMLRRM
jgi:TolA-binding protein